MESLATISVETKAIAILVATPIAILVSFVYYWRAWNEFGKGRFALDRELPLSRHLAAVEPAVDPAIQAAEVRQMLAAKSERLQRRGEAPLDVEVETARLLAEAPPPRDGADAELRAEVRQLVVARNGRRRRGGLEPLDVEAETDRQLADLIGSS